MTKSIIDKKCRFVELVLTIRRSLDVSDGRWAQGSLESATG